MGRKKMKIGEKVDIRLRLDVELAKRIQDVAEDDGTTVAGLIRTTMIRELKRREREGEAK